MVLSYAFRCIEAPDVPALIEMVDSGRNVTRATFLRHIGGVSELAPVSRSLGYVDHPSQGLTMAGDYHVSYSLSTYKGRACGFLTWSTIEYVWTEGGEA